MAVTENALSGINGTKKKFPFTFPYLKTTDLKVELVRTTTADGTKTTTTLDSTKFTFPTATEVELSAVDPATDWQETTGAPKADGSGYTYSGKVYRSTSSDALAATFYPGSAIRSADLNDNYTQNLYVTQEASNAVTDANTDAAAAVVTADAAKDIAEAADAIADDAADDVKRWIKDGDGSDTAGDEDDADFTARPLKPEGIPFLSNLVKTYVHDGTTLKGSGQDGQEQGVKYAVDQAADAVSTANTAETTANKARDDIAVALNYTIVADKAALIALTLNNSDDSETGNLGDFYEVTDATYINTDDIDDSTSSGGNITWTKADGTAQTTNPDTMTGVTWDDKITVKVRWRGDTEKWEYVSYRNVDPESNYVRSASPELTGSVTLKNNADLRLTETTANGSAYVGLKGPTDMGAASSYTVTLPTATPTANQILKADASTPTTLTWTDDVALTLINSDTFSGASTSNVNSATGTKNYVDTQVATKQDSDADLTAIAGLTSAADKGIQFTGSGTAATYDLTAFAKTILDDADAGAVRTTIGAGVGDAVLANDQSWSGAQRGTIPTPATHSSGATYDFDMNAGNNFKLTIGAAVELGFSNIAAGQSGTIEIVNGAFTPTWGSECHFVGGTVIDLTQSVTSYLSYYSPSASVVVVNELLDVKAEGS